MLGVHVSLFCMIRLVKSMVCGDGGGNAMVRKKSGLTIGKTRGFLYWLSPLLGDISAVSRGPGAMAKRVGRRAAGKAVGRGMGKWFK